MAPFVGTTCIKPDLSEMLTSISGEKKHQKPLVVMEILYLCIVPQLFYPLKKVKTSLWMSSALSYVGFQTMGLLAVFVALIRTILCVGKHPRNLVPQVSVPHHRAVFSGQELTLCAGSWSFSNIKDDILTQSLSPDICFWQQEQCSLQLSRTSGSLYLPPEGRKLPPQYQHQLLFTLERSRGTYLHLC